MAVFLLYLLLVPLALPLVLFAEGTYEIFVKQHAFNGDKLPDCNKHMNSVLEALNMTCRKRNTIILGDGSRYKTDLKEVTDVCRTGTNVRGNLTRSVNKFRVIMCNLLSGDQPPDCKYMKVRKGDILNKHITLRCVNQPVHLDSLS